MSTVKRVELIEPNPEDPVRVKCAGNIIEVRHMGKAVQASTLKLNKDYYIIPSEKTGEIHAYKHSNSRAENVINVSQSLARLRDLINANVADPEKARWVTLTYAENMRNPNTLYKDFHSFQLRLRRYAHNKYQTALEYIAVAEPQARGAWHLHCLFLFPDKAPFIPNEELKRLWRHGFVNVKSLKDIDNVGLYLSAYLTDMDVVDAFGTAKAPISADRLKEVEVIGTNDKKIPKCVVKGSRLNLYPPHFRIYRRSKGIKPPTVKEMTFEEAMQEVAGVTKTYEKAVNVFDDNGSAVNTISYWTYNRSPNAKCRIKNKESPVCGKEDML